MSAAHHWLGASTDALAPAFSLPSQRGMGRSLSLQQWFEYRLGIPTWLSSDAARRLTFFDPEGLLLARWRQ